MILLMILERFKDKLMKIPEYAWLFKNGYNVARICRNSEVEIITNYYESLGGEVAVRPYVVETSMRQNPDKAFVFTQGNRFTDGFITDTRIGFILGEQALKEVMRRREESNP